LRIDGVPVGREIPEALPDIKSNAGIDEAHEGSVIVVVATDAPLSSRQLERIARRASLGLARTGTASGNTSGDIILAFSTGNAVPMNGAARVMDARLLSTDHVDPLFRATVEATEEAVVNALMKGATMTGINGNTVYALPYDRLRQVMAKYGRPLK
jgi:D-aminopeptidase